MLLVSVLFSMLKLEEACSVCSHMVYHLSTLSIVIKAWCCCLLTCWTALWAFSTALDTFASTTSTACCTLNCAAMFASSNRLPSSHCSAFNFLAFFSSLNKFVSFCLVTLVLCCTSCSHTWMYWLEVNIIDFEKSKMEPIRCLTWIILAAVVGRVKNRVIESGLDTLGSNLASTSATAQSEESIVIKKYCTNES